MLEKPEFQDLNCMRPILKTLEENRSIVHWLLARTPDEGVSVTIGQENEPEAFRSCSLIATRYKRGAGNLGAIAVLGPKRMKYSRTLPLVSQMARMMRRFFDNTESHERE